MPADENSADSGTDQTPDQPSENNSVPENGGGSEEPRAGEDETTDDASKSGDGPEHTEEAPRSGLSGDSETTEDPESTGTSDTAVTGGDEPEDTTGAENKAEEAVEQAFDEKAPPESGSAAVTTNPAGKKGRRRLRRVVLWTAASLVALMCLGAATAYGYYYSLRSGMLQHDLASVLNEKDRPDKISDAVNILFIGSDGYEEDSPAYTQEFEGERSDSLMLAHISPDDRVSVISFPRDSLVQLPECDPYAKTEGTYGYFGMINAAMYHGGPPCVVRTIESLTDIRIDHFVHLSFASFRDVVDAIGGVDICIPEPMQDRRAKLDLNAGQQTLDGQQALSFVRARYDIGDGGDIGRIDRQQMFLAALADQVTSSDVLTSPSQLNGILQAVARHSATDQELSLDRMVSIAVTMTDVDLADIEFHTVPWYQAPYDPNRVMWYEEEATELFDAVREDRALPDLLAADDAPFPQEPPTASPTPADPSVLEGGGETPVESAPSARPGEGRDATSNPCQDGLGFGTGEHD